ncbi:MAG: hypothetical protein WCA42_03535, partial [Desulfobacterales bacterium]
CASHIFSNSVFPMIFFSASNSVCRFAHRNQKRSPVIGRQTPAETRIITQMMKMPIRASVVNGIGNILPKSGNPVEKQALSNDFLAGGVAIRNIATIFKN